MTLPKLLQMAFRGLLAWTLVMGAPSSAGGQELPARPPAVTTFFPLAEVRRGQLGVAYTVFEGTTPEPMGVEILGVLKDSQGPGRDLILARLRGAKPEYTGVVAGMSGSPVYLGGRLVGALSYRIGQFSKEPIAGITPIAEMLEVRDRPGVGPAPRAAAEGAPEMRPMETPLVFSGFSPETLERFGDGFRAMGLFPVAGLGGSDSAAVQPEPLVPGSAVSAILVRGDLAMAGTCTVTYVDPKQLLACGHPITQEGPVSMPMTKATVVATLPSPLNAFKIVNTTETVGSFTEDRASAIAGRFGVAARMIPVEVRVGVAKAFHFEVLDDRQLTPQTMLVSVYQALQGTNGAAAEQSYALAGELAIEGQPAVRMRGMMAPNGFNSAAANAALYVGERFSRVYENAAERPRVDGLALQLEAVPERRTATLESARLSRTEVRAGETVELEVTLRPYQAAARVEHVTVRLPESLGPGPLRLLVSDAGTVDRLTAPGGVAGGRSARLGEIVAGLNRQQANDAVLVTLLERNAQAVLGSGPLRELPLSMANVLDPLREAQQMTLSGESVVPLGEKRTGFAVTGSQVLRLTVR